MQAMKAPMNARGARAESSRWQLALLLVAMSAVSLFMWMGVPLAWLWIASQVASDYQTVYLWALLAIPVTMVGVGWVLYRLNAIYVRLSDEDQGPRQTTWLRAEAHDRVSREPRHAIDVIMACSVGLAVLAMAVWFFGFAGSPLPAGP